VDSNGTAIQALVVGTRPARAAAVREELARLPELTVTVIESSEALGDALRGAPCALVLADVDGSPLTLRELIDVLSANGRPVR
jgi:hypothetical protein